MRGLSPTALLAAAAALPPLATALDWDSTAHEILIPTTFPELEEPDPWYCAASNLTRFFGIPRPSETLSKSVQNRGASYFKECASTVTGRAALVVCNPSKEEWCQITTAMPPSAAHSSDALELAPLCPDNWYNAMFEFPAAESWLNLTIIFGACYEEALQATATTTAIEPSSTSAASSASTAVAGDLGTDQVVTATSGLEPENGIARLEIGTGVWMVTAVAVVAAVLGGF
ncbi:hypothetical protein F5X68DRAFT_277432 [Plectosphaerella plurivora]|uniref:DUF7735 domain-containing protein n=1 Tax=Plectosphaerella plurivora TaxID=936078 RepID=A0A9P8V8J3_9PEZI|nr:hypothetical protein F5X68DRAFT_277432 [Plectosphaerella plurivora]